MKLPDLLSHFAGQVHAEKDTAINLKADTPIESINATLVGTVGRLYLYSCSLPTPTPLTEDVPVTILPPGELEPTEGRILQSHDQNLLIQVEDSLGQTVSDITLVPDTLGFLDTTAERLADMAAKPESYSLGPAERLAPWVNPVQEPEHAEARSLASVAVLTTIWNEDPAARWTKLGTLTAELMRQHKRVLLLAPTHRSLDDVMGVLAKTLRAASLPFTSLLSRYESPILTESLGIPLSNLGFEAQIHGFYAKSRANKDALRSQYNRFRELTPILAYKGQKQRDLNEVKLLEWRLLAQLSEFQGKIRDIDKTVAEYESIPLWKRLGMQAVGKNVETLAQYKTIYEGKAQAIFREVEIAQARIEELKPEAAIPKDLRPEYDALKEEITRLGGTQKIRELLAAGEGTNRQAFLQNKRIVGATPGRVMTDPLFRKVRFDVLLVDDAPNIPAPWLLGAAGLIRERIILTGNLNNLSSPDNRSGSPSVQWRQEYFRADKK